MKVYFTVYMSKTWNEIGGVYSNLEDAQHEINTVKNTVGFGLDFSQQASIIERELDEGKYE